MYRESTDHNHYSSKNQLNELCKWFCIWFVKKCIRFCAGDRSLHPWIRIGRNDYYRADYTKYQRLHHLSLEVITPIPMLPCLCHCKSQIGCKHSANWILVGVSSGSDNGKIKTPIVRPKWKTKHEIHGRILCVHINNLSNIAMYYESICASHSAISNNPFVHFRPITWLYGSDLDKFDPTSRLSSFHHSTARYLYSSLTCDYQLLSYLCYCSFVCSLPS